MTAAGPAPLSPRANPCGAQVAEELEQRAIDLSAIKEASEREMREALALAAAARAAQEEASSERRVLAERQAGVDELERCVLRALPRTRTRAAAPESRVFG